MPDQLEVAYEELSQAFTLVNKAYNKAIHDNALTDELELKFLRAERGLQEAYRAQQEAKIEGVG